MGKAAKRNDRTSAREEIPSAADWTPGRTSGRPAEEAIAYGVADQEEQRTLGRLSPRELGRVQMALRAPKDTSWTPIRLRDFTSIGFGVDWEATQDLDSGNLQDPVLSRSGSREGPQKGEPSLKEGDEVEVRISIQARQDFTFWCKVMNLAHRRNGMQIGLRRLDIGFPQAISDDRRTTPRLALAPALALGARVRHPFLYNRWCAIQVTDINKDMGLSLSSSDPTILVFEGMELDLHFELAEYRAFPMTVRVAWAHANSTDVVRFGVQCRAVDWRLHNAICDYLLNTQFWTPVRLRQAGFHSKQVKGHLRFATVKTMEDYAEVLYLRRDSYVGVGKRPQGTRPEKMSNPLDGKSRIMMATHHGKLVGTMTLTFPNSEDTVLDTQVAFPGGRYPVPLPPKANLIEVARLCIDENYRGTDLLIGMFENGLKHFLMSDRHWIITSAADELWPIYERIGFVKLKASYKHPLLNNLEHHLIIAHRSAFLWGWGIGILTWNAVFSNLVKHVLERKLVEVPGWIRAIIKVKLFLRPLARLLADTKARAAFRKHLRALLWRTHGKDIGPEPVVGSLYASGVDEDGPLRIIPGPGNVDPNPEPDDIGTSPAGSAGSGRPEPV